VKCTWGALLVLFELGDQVGHAGAQIRGGEGGGVKLGEKGNQNND